MLHFIRTVEIECPYVISYCDIAHELRMIQHERRKMNSYHNESSFNVLLNYLVEVEDSMHTPVCLPSSGGVSAVPVPYYSRDSNIWLAHVSTPSSPEVPLETHVCVMAMITFSLYVPIDVLVAALERLYTYQELVHVMVDEKGFRRPRALLTGRGVIKLLMIVYAYLPASFVDEMIRVSRMCVWKLKVEKYQ
jgi:hypothetical protein